ncbi:MAG TPA: TonB-dependent receptor [Thermoanaerobaculia bacterium]|nr:TonB-dependent receptor [Thermoanaerobaculia bacterium]
MTRFPRFFIVVAALLCAFSALAQGTTGVLTGTATSEGAPLPGVSVTVSSPSLQGTRTTVTSETGGYVVPALPPGEYTVSFELSGMAVVTKKATVMLAQTSRVDAALQVSAIAESITVTASAPAVLENSQVAANFTGELIDALPVTRDIRSTVILSPGVTPTGPGNNLMISGAPAYDSVYLVNGVVVNENLRGQAHQLFIEDAIQETTVLSGGAISAEYGRFTGGVVSTLTRSGGNAYTGSLRDSLSNAAWTAKTPFPGQADAPDELMHLYEGTLGGFFVRDRLWFFGAGRYSAGVPVAGANSTQRFTATTALPYQNSVDEKRYEVKLTGRITDRHSLIGSYLDVKLDETGNAFTPIYDLDSVVPVRSLPNTLMALNYNGVLTNNLLVEAQYSDKFFAFQNSGGLFTDPVRGTWIQDGTTGVRFNAPVFCGVCTAEERNNDSWIAKANYFLSTSSLGSHNIIGGVENFAETRIANNFQSASQYQVTTGGTHRVGNTIFPRFDATTALIYRPILELTPGTDFKTQSVFVNDKWDFNQHWSFNLGVRYDKNDGKDASGNVVSDDSAFSPRLGVIYDVMGNGMYRVNASYARYVSKIADGNVGGSAQAAGNPAYFRYNYNGPAINPAGTAPDQLIPTHTALQMLFDWFEDGGGFAGRTPNGTFVPGFGTRFDDPIVSPYVDELNIGAGTRLGASGFARLDLISREWGNFYAAQLDTSTGTIVDPFNVRGDIGVTVNDDSIERTYKGASLQAQWAIRRVSLGGNYTWSKLEGNDEGEAQGTATSRNQPLALWYPEYLNYGQRLPDGYLTGDVRNIGRVWASYDLPTPVGKFNFSALQTYASGQAFSAIAQIDATGLGATNRVGTGTTPAWTAPANPGYTLSQIGNLHNYYLGQRGSFRTDNRTTTDVAVNYTLPIGRVSLFAQGELINAFNEAGAYDLASSRINTTVFTRRQRPTVLDTSIPAGSVTPIFAAFDPRTAPDQLRQYIPGVSPKTNPDGSAAIYHYQLHPDFGKAASPEGYQQARTYRFSLGLRF